MAGKNQKGSGVWKGAAVMTVFSFATKGVGVLLRLYLSSRIGSEGMGLYQLILSVYGLFAALATAGLTVAVSRLSAEKPERAGNVLSASTLLGLLVSGVSAGVLFTFSGKIAATFLGDGRLSAPLRILAFSLPCMAVAACFKGRFIAERQVLCSSSASLFEQCVKFAVTAWFLTVAFGKTNDPATLCKGVVLGVTLGEASSFLYLLLAFLLLKKKECTPKTPADGVFPEVCRVVLPLGGSVAVTSVLHTVESLLIPAAFEKFGGDRVQALAEFGVIRGMVIPLLFFPFSFLSSFVTVMIPEIARLNKPETLAERGRKVEKTVELTLLLSIPVGGLFLFLGGAIGETFYPGKGTAEALFLLAPVTPLMYVQTICDGLLKACDGQKYTLRYSVYNSVLRIAAVLFFIPRLGSRGYLWLLVLSNTLEFGLCFFRLEKIAGFRSEMRKNVLAPLAFSLLAGVLAKGVTTVLPLPSAPLSAAVGTVVYGGVAVCCSLLCRRMQKENDPLYFSSK